MGLWFWKPDEVVNPQQPLSAQLYGQGDPGEGWSQSRSATPASLADSYGGSGVCSFDAPNRSDGMPDLLFGMDVQLYGSWSQVGKVTDVETDGDYTSYNVDDVLARFNKQVKVGPLAVGYTSPIQYPPLVDDPRAGDPDWEATQQNRYVSADYRGRIVKGLWVTEPGGKTRLYGSPNFDGWEGYTQLGVTTSQYAASPIYEVLSSSSTAYLVKFDPDDGRWLSWVEVADTWNGTNGVFAYRDELIYVVKSTLGASTPIPVDVYNPDLELVRTFTINLPTWLATVNAGLLEVTVDEYSNEIYVGTTYRSGVGSSGGQYRSLAAFRFDSNGSFLSEMTWDMDPDVNYSGGGRLAAQLASMTYARGVGVVLIASDMFDSGAWNGPTGTIRGYTPVNFSGSAWSYTIQGVPVTVNINLASVWNDRLGLLVISSASMKVPGTGASSGYALVLLTPPTLRQAYLMYMLEAGVPLDIAIDNSSVFDEEVSYPDWEGNLLDKLVELASVTRTQFSPGTLPGTIVVEEIGGTMHKQLPQAVGGKPSLSLGTGQAVDSYTVVSQQARVVNPDDPEVVWDARVENELIEFGLSEVKKVTLETPHSLTGVVMPVRGLGFGEYAVADSEGNNITDAFEDAGGYVSATVNPDNPRAIDVEVFSGRGSIGANRPYSLGYRQTTNGQIVPRFSILGSGVFLDPQEATIWTGADPSFTTGGNGPRYESEFISSWDDAYSAANKISSMSVTPSMDVSLSVPDGVERGTGNVGDRFEHNHGVWRLMSVATDGHTAQWQLQPSTTVGDHDERWAGAKVSDHDSFWDGRTVQDVRVRPLWSDWDPYPGEPIFLKMDDDSTPYWSPDPPPESWVMVDDEDGPYWTPQNGPGTKVIKLDTDGKPYYIDEGVI